MPHHPRRAMIVLIFSGRLRWRELITSMVSEDQTARIAQKLRDAGLECEILNLVPTDPALLRRDRTIVVLVLILLTALAWSYLLWLSHAMVMDGMAMDDFRMWTHDARADAVANDGVRVRVRDVDRDDGRHDDAMGRADDSHVCPCEPTRRTAGHAAHCGYLVRGRLLRSVDRFRGVRHRSAVGA